MEGPIRGNGEKQDGTNTVKPDNRHITITERT